MMNYILKTVLNKEKCILFEQSFTFPSLFLFFLVALIFICYHFLSSWRTLFFKTQVWEQYNFLFFWLKNIFFFLSEHGGTCLSISRLERLKHKDREFEVTLGYIVRQHLKKRKERPLIKYNFTEWRNLKNSNLVTNSRLFRMWIKIICLIDITFLTNKNSR
jgi:hypothetical protein